MTPTQGKVKRSYLTGGGIPRDGTHRKGRHDDAQRIEGGGRPGGSGGKPGAGRRAEDRPEGVEGAGRAGRLDDRRTRCAPPSHHGRLARALRRPPRPTTARRSSSAPRASGRASRRGSRSPSSPPDCRTRALSSPRPTATCSSPRARRAASGPSATCRRATGKPEINAAFATGLRQPFGIAVHPPGPEPTHVYVANTDSVVRFPYKNGDTKAGEKPETIVPDILRRRGHSRGRALDARRRVLEGRPANVRLRRVQVQRRRRRGRKAPRRHPGVRLRREK